MSLHNSTIIENRKRTFLNIVDLGDVDEQPAYRVPKQIISPATAGFDLRGDADKQGSESDGTIRFG